MSRIDHIDFQTRTQPLAYLLTFRCYGTWLHGEERGSVDRRRYHRYGTPDMPANKRILSDERRTLKSEPLLLNKPQRETVQAAIREVCESRRYSLHAISVRTNHVHVVVGSIQKPGCWAVSNHMQPVVFARRTCCNVASSHGVDTA